jgi:hypothetical protein
MKQKSCRTYFFLSNSLFKGHRALAKLFMASSELQKKKIRAEGNKIFNYELAVDSIKLFFQKKTPTLNKLVLLFKIV